jgi:hypothetical protein
MGVVFDSLHCRFEPLGSRTSPTMKQAVSAKLELRSKREYNFGRSRVLTAVGFHSH